MPTTRGVITAQEYMSAVTMSTQDTVDFINSCIKKAMLPSVLSVGFFTITIKPEHNVELMISLIRDAGFTVGRTQGSDQRESWDYLRVEVPRASKV